MFQALRGNEILSAAAARRLRVAALVLLLLLTWQALREVGDPARLQIAVAATLVIGLGWLVQIVRPNVASIWLLGLGATVLVLVVPGAGAVFGIAAAIVTAATRLDQPASMLTATVLTLAFLAAEGVGSNWSSPLSLGLNAVGLCFAYLGSRSIQRLREERERAERLLAELRRTRDAQIQAAALDERARIAREIHDVLAHTLSALAVQLQGASMLLEQRPDDHAAAQSAVDRAHRLAREGLDETRRAVGALRGDRLPGADQLARLASEFSATSETPCQFSIEGTPHALDAEAHLAVYRTAQEALTNIHKHADATSVAMRLHYLPDATELVVEDHGVAPVFANGASAGYGLAGMRERAELLGGTLEAGPVPDGFRVRLWLPNR